MSFLEKINWQKVDNLLPVIVQEVDTNEVLMQAYMNKEALNLSLESGFAHYYSRTKKRIWKKGESSGHTQEIREFLLDCDFDTLLIKVKQNGVACHTGRKTCFFNNILSNDISLKPKVSMFEINDIINTLHEIIQLRKVDDPQVSYIAKLFSKGENTILKKVCEESAEFCFATKDKNEKEIIYEAADLIFHLLVALGYSNIHFDEVKQELKRRFGKSGIEEKNERKN